jgi:hypothetical protein
MAGKWSANPKVHKLIQDRHRRYGKHIDEDGYFHAEDGSTWKVPYGVRLCLRRPLVAGQIYIQYPWVVTWISPKTHRRMRKRFATPYAAFDFIATKAQHVDSKCAFVARNVGYDVPSKLRGKIPAPWKWCPRCMTARRFKAVVPELHFYALRKELNGKGQWELMERKLREMRCTVCGVSNRDPKMRRSNQPWTKTTFKPGVRRVRRKRRVLRS